MLGLRLFDCFPIRQLNEAHPDIYQEVINFFRINLTILKSLASDQYY